MRTEGWSDYAFFATGTAPVEYGWITGSAYSPKYGLAYRGMEDYPPVKPETWQCSYCGSKHWVENKELGCKKCGAPRDI